MVKDTRKFIMKPVFIVVRVRAAGVYTCVAACSGPARTTQTLVPAHTGASVGTWRGAHG